MSAMSFKKALNIIYIPVSAYSHDKTREQTPFIETMQRSGTKKHLNSTGNACPDVHLDSIVQAVELKSALRVLHSMVAVGPVRRGLSVNPVSILVHVHSDSIYL